MAPKIEGVAVVYRHDDRGHRIVVINRRPVHLDLEAVRLLGGVRYETGGEEVCPSLIPPKCGICFPLNPHSDLSSLKRGCVITESGVMGGAEAPIYRWPQGAELVRIKCWPGM